MELMEAIRTRRSIRKWTDQPVPDELIDKMIEAARWAPSAHNIQPAEYIIVRDQKVKDELSEMTMAGHAKRMQGWTHDDVLEDLKTLPVHLRQDDNVVKKQYTTFYRYLALCPVIIGVVGNTKVPMSNADKLGYKGGRSSYHLFDTFMAIQNMLLAAHDLGLGAIVHIRALMVDRERVRKLLEVPDDYALHALVCVGYPAEKPVVEKKSVEQIRHYEKFGRKTK